MPRTSAQATRPTVREDNSPVAKKVRLRKNAAQRSILDIPDDMLAIVRQNYGADLQWVTDTVHGEVQAGVRNDFEINCWEPVTPQMWGGLFDGMFTKRGHVGEINYGGLVLMWRPYELTEESRAEEAKDRHHALEAQKNMIKGGNLPGFSAGFEPDHPTAVSRNVVARTIKPPMDIPRD